MIELKNFYSGYFCLFKKMKKVHIFYNDQDFVFLLIDIMA